MAQQEQLDLDLLLPEISSVQDACVARLAELLEAKTGVSSAHPSTQISQDENRLCVHFDASVVSVGELREFATRAGATLAERYGHFVRRGDSMPPRRARRLARELFQVPGVLEAVVSPDGTARVEFDRDLGDPEAIETALHSAVGAPPAAPPPSASDDHEDSHEGFLSERAELIATALCGATLLLAWLAPKYWAVPVWAETSLLISAFVFGGFFTVREAIAHLKGGSFEIDFLMIVAAFGAGMLGEWAEGALLLFLFSLGHALEGYAMGRAKRAIEALAEIAPSTALVIKDGREEEVLVETLQVGDVILVKPNQRIAGDGFVIKGESSVNQAPITGESAPVDKQPVADARKAADRPASIGPENRVFAGTINGAGALEVQIIRAASDSTLARVVQMVGEAETNRSPTQEFTDRFERIFVPVVLAGAGVSMFAWVVLPEPFSASFYRSMALLVAASPCALAIATPSAVLSGVARAARGGVLIKGGSPLEHLGRLEAIAFDKTGTLTEGKPRVVDVVPAADSNEQALLRAAVAVESLSDHPLAAAVVRDGTKLLDEPPTKASGLSSITGRGVKAEFEGIDVVIGNADLFDEIDGPPLGSVLRAQTTELEEAGRTTMIVRSGGRFLGVIGLMDSPRDSAKSVIERLRELGITRMLMLSGDNQQVANGVAKEVGLDEARGNLMPEDKVEAVKQLRATAAVAMVGDGVNDAPAMANATVGIAMGAAGSDVALETADVALMADDLNRLPFAVGLSRATSRAIRQNLWISLGVVAVLVPATLGGLKIGAAVAIHEGSTLVVVLNALRLLAFRETPR